MSKQLLIGEYGKCFTFGLHIYLGIHTMLVSHRLLLLGGLSTILEQMESDEVKPDIKTYTLMLDVIPATDAAEEVRMTVKS